MSLEHLEQEQEQ